MNVAVRKPFKLYCELETTSTKDWLVKNLLGLGEASAFYGMPGCGKSALVEDMGLHIAAGLPWHGREVTQGAVCYVALERKLLVERRAIAFRERHGIPGLPFAIVGGVFDFRTPQTAEAMASIIRQVREATGQEVVLVVIDTISRALAGGDENSSKDMGAIVTTTARLQEATKPHTGAATGAHIQWVHHVPIDGGERLRGHGALLGALDTTINVEKLASGLRTATVIKANDSEEGEKVAFTLDSVSIGPETTAPVVVPADCADIATARSTGRRLSPRQSMAMKALAETVLSSGKSAPAEYDLPAGIRVVEQDDWRNELLRQNVIDGQGANPREDFKRTRNQLIARGLIGCRDRFVWSAAA